MAIGGVPVEPDRKIVQVGGGEPPLERLCRGVVAVFGGSEPLSGLGEVGEVVGREGLALHGSPTAVVTSPGGLRPP